MKIHLYKEFQINMHIFSMISKKFYSNDVTINILIYFIMYINLETFVFFKIKNNFISLIDWNVKKFSVKFIFSLNAVHGKCSRYLNITMETWYKVLLCILNWKLTRKFATQYFFYFFLRNILTKILSILSYIRFIF